MEQMRTVRPDRNERRHLEGSAASAPLRTGASRAASAASGGSAPILSVRGVSKSWGDHRALDHVSLEVEPGSIFGFVGHNGAGKTTLIRAIVGALSFDEGDIRILGTPIGDDPVGCKRALAYVPDNPDVYTFLTGQQYLDYIADLYEVGTRRRRERGSYLTERLGIADRLGELVSAYSHGMRQKLVLAGALLHDPKLLVLDEPFVGLDPEAAFNLKDLMRETVEGGGAIFFSSHVLEVVEKLCDRIAVIRRGRIVRSGTVPEVRGDESLEEVFLELVREGNGKGGDSHA